jgi:DNA-binding winged helix-turn-helix (wHTH) protein
MTPRTPSVIVDKQKHEVIANGNAVYLAPKEFSILVAIAEAGGKVLGRITLLETIWGYNPGEVDIDTRTVDQHVARLRSKLDKHGVRGIITTVPNFGYKSNSITIKDPDTQKVGKVERIDRVYGKTPGSRVTMFVPDLMPMVVKGHSLRLS